MTRHLTMPSNTARLQTYNGRFVTGGLAGISDHGELQLNHHTIDRVCVIGIVRDS